MLCCHHPQYHKHLWNYHLLFTSIYFKCKNIYWMVPCLYSQTSSSSRFAQKINYYIHIKQFVPLWERKVRCSTPLKSSLIYCSDIPDQSAAGKVHIQHIYSNKTNAVFNQMIPKCLFSVVWCINSLMVSLLKQLRCISHAHTHTHTLSLCLSFSLAAVLKEENLQPFNAWWLIRWLVLSTVM